MQRIKKTQSVPYSAAQMYALVNDVDHYAEFVPWCVDSAVLQRSHSEVHARLTFASGAIKKSFTTQNRLQLNHRIDISLVDGPFHHLSGFWLFTPDEAGGSVVSLELEFEFSTRLLGIMFGPVFNQVASTLVDAFSQRAEAVYG